MSDDHLRHHRSTPAIVGRPPWADNHTPNDKERHRLDREPLPAPSPFLRLIPLDEKP